MSHFGQASAEHEEGLYPDIANVEKWCQEKSIQSNVDWLVLDAYQTPCLLDATG